MRRHQIENGKKRLTRPASPPVRFTAALVPGRPDPFCFLRRVIVRLFVIGAVIAGPAKIGGKGNYEVGNRKQRPQVLRAQRGCVHATDQAGPSRRTDGCRSKRMRIANAFPGQGVDPRRRRVRVAVAPKMRTHVFAGDPENIGPRDFRRLVGHRRRTPQSDQENPSTGETRQKRRNAGMRSIRQDLQNGSPPRSIGCHGFTHLNLREACGQSVARGEHTMRGRCGTRSGGAALPADRRSARVPPHTPKATPPTTISLCSMLVTCDAAEPGSSPESLTPQLARP
jgi:hypothetical protein